VLALLLPVPALADVQVEVSISGVEGKPLDNVRASLSLLQREGQLITLRTARDLHGRAAAEIERALQPFGYYRVEVNASLLPVGDQDLWSATYDIVPGDRVPVTALTLDIEGPGADDELLTAVLDDWPLQPGEFLDHQRYRQGKESLLAAATPLGYRDADWAVHRVEVDLNSYSAAIVLRLDSGPRYVFGPVTFESDDFDHDFLEKFVLIEEGAPFDQGQLSAQRRAFSASGFFREVDIEMLSPSEEQPNVVPLRVGLVPFPPNRYRGRLAWGTDTGVGVQFGWTRRYLGSRGQNFSLGLAAVQERNKLAGDLNYVIPVDPLTESQVKFGARHESKDLNFEDVDLDQGGETRIETNLLGALWQSPTRYWGSFTVTPEVGLTFVQEEYDVFEVLFGNLPQLSQDLIRERIGEQAYDTLAPDFSALAAQGRLTLRRADGRLYIRDGDYLRFDMLYTSEAMGSSLDFWQTRLQSWHIRSFGDRSRVLARSRLGYSEADNREVLSINFNDMPEYYEFRAGGARSIRGYGFETLFPEDTITGGKHELVLSLEYEYEVIPDWSIAGFVDSGNAFNSWDDFDEKTGVGIGMRWRSPVGLVRIDLGVPLDDADESFEVYITVGPEF
jgi:translocation and assembly module TamA